jgi:uncharacterized protein YycO
MIEVFFSDSDQAACKLIRAVTWSDYAHVGFYDRSTGNVIDSRMKNKGVTEYSYEKLKLEYPRIIMRSFPEVPREALAIARSQIGKGYDWTALFGIGLHRDWQEDDKWFCSELVAWACAQAGKPIINKETYRVVPQDVLEVSSAGLFG